MKLTLFCPFAAMTPKRKFVRFGRWSDARTHQPFDVLTPHSFRSLSGNAFDATRTNGCDHAADDRQAREAERGSKQRTELAWARSRKRGLRAITNSILNDGKHLTPENSNYSNEHELLHIFIIAAWILLGFFFFVISSNGYTLSIGQMQFFLLLLLTSPHTWISNERGEKKSTTSMNINIIIITYSAKREILQLTENIEMHRRKPIIFIGLFADIITSAMTDWPMQSMSHCENTCEPQSQCWCVENAKVHEAWSIDFVMTGNLE